MKQGAFQSDCTIYLKLVEKHLDNLVDYIQNSTAKIGKKRSPHLAPSLLKSFQFALDSSFLVTAWWLMPTTVFSFHDSEERALKSSKSLHLTNDMFCPLSLNLWQLSQIDEFHSVNVWQPLWYTAVLGVITICFVVSLQQECFWKAITGCFFSSHCRLPFETGVGVKLGEHSQKDYIWYFPLC